LAVCFTPPLAASRIKVRFLIGDAPGAGFDFAALYFHVPSVLSAPNAMAAIASTANVMRRTLFIFCSPGEPE
jgi:hypothetical protein